MAFWILRAVVFIFGWVFSSDFLSQPNQLENLVKHSQSLIGYERQLGALKKFDSRSWLQEIIASLSGAKEVQEKIGNNTKLDIIPGGHASPVEQPKKVVDSILKFIG